MKTFNFKFNINDEVYFANNENPDRYGAPIKGVIKEVSINEQGITYLVTIMNSFGDALTTIECSEDQMFISQKEYNCQLCQEIEHEIAYLQKKREQLLSLED